MSKKRGPLERLLNLSIGQRVRLSAALGGNLATVTSLSIAPAGLATTPETQRFVAELDAHHLALGGHSKRIVVQTAAEWLGFGGKADITRIRGKPYIAGYDPPRAMGALAVKARYTAVPVTSPRSTGETPVTTTAVQPVILASDFLAALTKLVSMANAEAAGLVEGGDSGVLTPDVPSTPPDVTPVAPPTRKRKASTESPITALLTPYYVVGKEAHANVLLASPSSYGKSYAIRAMGAAYDTYLEHGCSEDMDEISTLLGSPVPDGKGGFIVVDGVVTEAVRNAANGKNTLLMLDEVLRLTSRAQEWLLTFLTGVKTPTGRVYRLRTRRALPDGTLETIECPVERLHIVSATNLTIISPIEAFWSRWETVRVEFTIRGASKTASAILASRGIDDPDRKLAKAWARIVKDSRESQGDGSTRFPVDFRMLERAAAMAPERTAQAVAALARTRIADNTANWNPDTGDIAPESVARAVKWVAALDVIAGNVNTTGTLTEGNAETENDDDC